MMLEHLPRSIRRRILVESLCQRLTGETVQKTRQMHWNHWFSLLVESARFNCVSKLTSADAIGVTLSSLCYQVDIIKLILSCYQVDTIT